MERHFDFENKEIYFQTDDYGIVVIKDILSSRRDGIGRTFMAYYAYGNKCFVDDIEKCHRIAFGTIFWGRHPDEPPGDMSRDHVNYTLLALHYSGRISMLRYISATADKRISDKFKFTHDMWLWMKAIAGSKWALRRYYAWTWLGSLLVPIWNAYWRKWADVSEEVDQDDWDLDTIRNATERQIFARTMVKPQYAIAGNAWQLSTLPESKILARRRRRLLKVIGKKNYLIRMILKDPCITKEDFSNYKQMTGWRWSTSLDALSSRGCEIMEPPKFPVELISANRIEEDVLWAAWNKNYK